MANKIKHLTTGLVIFFCFTSLVNASDLDEGLVAYWSFDNVSGDTVYDEAGNNDGTNRGAAWVDNGKYGKALSFDGKDDYVDVVNPSFSINNYVTVSLWVYGDTSQPRSDTLFEGRDAPNYRVINVHLPWGDSNVYWDAGNSGTSSYDRIYKASSLSEFKGRWNHWVFTKDAVAGTMKIYLNGAKWHSGTGKTRTMSTITTFKIGSAYNAGSPYAGLIDEVRIYNRALTADEIQMLSNLKPDGGSCSEDSECYSKHCVHEICRPTDPYCGDNHCDSGEDYSSCSSDCKKPDGEICTDNDECNSSYCNNFCCASGTCCSSDQFCSPTQNCSASYQCQNLTCPAGEQPENHQCVAIDRYCTSNEDCADSEHCVDNSCTPLSCKAGEEAKDHECVPIPEYCTSDADCADDEYCYKHNCESLSCKAGEEAKDHECVAVEGYCTSNADCADSERCVDNICTPLSCKPGEEIKDHKCVPIPGYCTSNENCTDDEHCEDNICTLLSCKPGEEIKDHGCVAILGYCTSNDTCSDDQSCLSNICTPLNCSKGEQAQDHQCQPSGISPGLIGVIAVIIIIIIIIAVLIFLWKRPSKLDLVATPMDIPADGKSTSTIILTIKNIFGKALTAKNDIPVTLSTSDGKIADKVTISKGSTSATAVLTSSTTPEAVTVSAIADLNGSISVTFRPTGKRFCMHCGAQMISETDPCPRCKKMPPSGVDTKNCPNCNAVVPSIAKFCKVCGAGQPG